LSGTPAGRLLGYVRAVARRMDLRVDESIASIPQRYEERAAAQA
jgi:hypothetical protein